MLEFSFWGLALSLVPHGKTAQRTWFARLPGTGMQASLTPVANGSPTQAFAKQALGRAGWDD